MSLSTLFFNSYFFKTVASFETFSRIIDSTGSDQAFGIACDSSGNVYIVGSYNGTPSIKTQFAGTVGLLPVSTTNAVYVCKFDSNGTYLYSRTLDTAASDQGFSVTCDSFDNMYFSGFYTGTPTIKDQTGASLGTLPASTGQTAFACKFDSSGTYLYSRIVDGTSNDQGFSVECDSSGNMYIAGFYTGTSATIKDQTGASLGTLPASSPTNISSTFVCKFNSSGTYQYSRIVDSANADQGRCVSCDSSGNVYYGGYYSGAATIKDQTGASLGTLPATSGLAAFVCKFDSTGTYQYARLVDGAGSDVAYTVVCDSSNNLYIAGLYSGTSVIKNQAGTSLGTLPASTGDSAYVSKFDSTGTYLYSRIIDSGGSDTVYGVTLDSSGNLYLAGYYNGTPIIKNQSGTSLGTLPTSVSETAFLCKFDSSGAYLYARLVDGAGSDQGTSIACDTPGNVYLAGYYNGTPTIKDQTGASLGTLPVSVGIAGFFTRFKSDGTYSPTIQTYPTYSRILDTGSLINGLARDSSNNVYITGYYTGTPTIKDQAGTSLGTLPASTGTAAVVCKFDSTGAYQYSRIVDSSSNEQGLGVTCDSAGNMYLSGSYNSTPTIKDQTGASLGTLPASSASIDAFVSKFDSTGTYLYTRIVVSAGTDQGTSVTCDSSGNMYIAGYYGGTTPTIKDQAGTSLGTLPNSAGGTVAFVCKFDSSGAYQYSRIVDSTASDQCNSVSCDSSGNMYLAGSYAGTPTIKDQTGASLGTLPNSAGGTTAFACKFDSTGAYQYSRVVDSVVSDSGNSVTCDSSGNMYFAGSYGGTPTIKNQAGTSLGTLPVSSGTAAFACKFDSTGSYLYSRTVDSAGADSGNSVTCDSSGNMYFAGSYGGTPTIKNQAGTSLGTLPVSSGAAAFMCKFDSTGSYLYSRILDATTTAEGGSCSVCDSYGNVYLGGSYNAVPTIKDQIGASLGTLPTNTGSAGFMIKFNSDGAYVV